jgi:eukaryotic-like serine/threonine-protein kinase
MSITIGSQLGSLEVTALLGKGGMGEVYRARDTKLKREVAIKILPEEFARDPDRVNRFQREAEVLASLNHPNIAAIYDLQEAGGLRFLVLELVEGDTLAGRLEHGPIPVDQALRIAKNICEALEAAHEKGVVHRDLKPGNVKVTPDGNVKVLDFGLAKAVESQASSPVMSNSPTLTLAGTNPGIILGTAAYMSPEQARGRTADQRSDVFSFGCMLYEMLTGHQAFQGEEVSDVLASVLKSEPDFNLLPPQLNPRIHEVLRRCLQKSAKLRWHAIGDARVEIEAVLADPRGVILVEQERTAALKPPLWRRAIPILAAVILTATVTGVGLWNLKPSPVLPVTRFPLILGEGQQFTAASRTLVGISPDGTQIVYEANRQLYHRAMSELEARPIPGSQAQTPQSFVVNPVFSPDGRSIVYFASADSTLKRIAVSGGAAVTICQADPPFGVTWGEDGILFAQGSKGILRVFANGGKPETIVALKDGEVAQGPQMLPGAQAVLFTLAKGQATDWDNAQIVVQSLKSGERKPLWDRGSDARYVPTGHIVYSFGGTLFALPFDVASLKVTGGPVPLVEGVRRGGIAVGTGAAHYSFSNTGSLIYVSGPVSAASEKQILALMDRKGMVEPLKVPPRPYGFPRISPDGKHIAFGSEAGEANIWIYDLGGTIAPRQLTVGGANRYPVWTGDSKRVAFQSDREGDLAIFWQPADGSGTAERLTKPEQGFGHIPDSWSPNGEGFSFTAVKGTEGAVWFFSLKDKKATVFAQSPSKLVGRSAFAPDGRWLAYQSNETGGARIWVQPFPATGAKYPIVDGGQPFWSPDGKELFYNAAPQLTAVVNITTRPNFGFSGSIAVPRALNNRSPQNFPRNSDITPDGKYFVGVINADQNQSGSVAAPQIQVVLNWFEDIKQRMSAR